MIELVLMGPQTRFDVTQTLSEGELRKCHAKELVEAGEGLNVTIAPDSAGRICGTFSSADVPSPEKIRVDPST